MDCDWSYDIRIIPCESRGNCPFYTSEHENNRESPAKLRP